MKLLSIALALSVLACGGKPSTPTPPDTTQAAAPAPAPETAPPPAPDVAAVAAPDAAPAPAPDPEPAPAPDAPPAAAGPEHVIWYTTAQGSKESAWLRPSGDGYEVVARRAEPVVSDGKTVWALHTTERKVPLAPCPEDGADDPTAAPPDAQTALVRGLALRPLGAGEPAALRPLPTDAFFVGDYDQSPLVLLGSDGARVIYSYALSTFSCGAHPNNEWGTVLVGPGSEPTLLWTLLEPRLGARVSDMTPKVLAKVEAAECREHFTSEGTQARVSAVTSRKAGERLVTTVSWALSTDMHAMQACETALDEDVELGALEPFGAPPAHVAKALRELAAEGPVGWAELPTDATARESARAAFEDTSTVSAPSSP